MSQITAWVVDDDESIRWVLERTLTRAEMQVRSFPGSAELLDAIIDETPDVLLTDIRMPGINGLALLERLQAAKPELPVIIMTAHSDLDAAVAAYQGGAFEYLPKPFDVEGVAALVRRAARSVKRGNGQAPDADASTAIIGEAPAMQEVFRAIGRLSQSQITVLITGETGSGKELVAKALHDHSPRAGKPFIAVNTAAIPKDLMESEFFGHERGAFTGAQTQRKGRFEMADGGGLFLDEIGDMPADLQTRLLRVLADGEFYRVGGTTPIKVDVRVIAATHQDLEQAVKAGHFREDLFHRLNVIRIRIPSLRERREDVPLLLQYFLRRVAKELKADAKRLRPEVMQLLQQLDWPGNVRQLENICRWLTVMAPGQDVHIADLPPELRGETVVAPRASNAEALPDLPQMTSPASVASDQWPALLRDWAHERLAAGNKELTSEAEPLFERALIEVALEHSKGQRQEAARLLGWGRNTLTRKIKSLGH